MKGVVCCGVQICVHADEVIRFQHLSLMKRELQEMTSCLLEVHLEWFLNESLVPCMVTFVDSLLASLKNDQQCSRHAKIRGVMKVQAVYSETCLQCSII